MRTSFCLSLILLFTAFCSSASNYRPEVGRVLVNGQIQTAACSIHMDDVWQEVDFGSLPMRYENGIFIATRKVKIDLVNCQPVKEDSEQWRSVTVIFDGEPAENGADLFAINSKDAGIALAIIDDRGNLAKPGETLSDVNLESKKNQIGYWLSVISMKQSAIAGEWSGGVRFIVSYL